MRGCPLARARRIRCRLRHGRRLPGRDEAIVEPSIHVKDVAHLLAPHVSLLDAVGQAQNSLLLEHLHAPHVVAKELEGAALVLGDGAGDRIEDALAELRAPLGVPLVRFLFGLPHTRSARTRAARVVLRLARLVHGRPCHHRRKRRLRRRLRRSRDFPVGGLRCRSGNRGRPDPLFCLQGRAAGVLALALAASVTLSFGRCCRRGRHFGARDLDAVH
mmetsp:Transcript_101077/g.324676  ORF Transcript_101077/g.324676 Transcript_101077/m.324676 type:complete len:217 (+) Transcript_101077:486-1136(+)